MHLPGTTRFFRGTSRHDCKSDECLIYDHAFEWAHWATTFDPENGEPVPAINRSTQTTFHLQMNEYNASLKKP